MRLHFLAAVGTALILSVQPALAQPDDVYDHGMPEAAPMHHARPDGPRYAFDPAARDAWLADCRSRVSRRDSGVGGALIGGAVGGLAGNRIAGSGNRTVGTIAGAVVGAAVGAAIDKAEDAGRYRDECEAYLDDYYAWYTRSANYSPGYGYGPATYVAPMSRPEPECTETIEYVYEDVPERPAPRKRYIPRHAPDKRIKIVPDKRVPIK
ncbi:MULTISPECIES: glycine zipper 2TM domain-containing protein [Novosphingobium]|uniref:17 kDa surface antigen n=1 Tax=Novosphingobium mathurense TaxID=428990 RepID=A0A1U6HC25_9SPHN